MEQTLQPSGDGLKFLGDPTSILATTESHEDDTDEGVDGGQDEKNAHADDEDGQGLH